MANYTTNLHLEKPEYNETADIEIINQNMEKIDSEMTYKTATGTGTEIKLSLPETFGNGYNTTFIASANNGAAATTINGKPLYKPNTTTPPNITSGKAYSIWYNAPGDCFFLKASAEGNAHQSSVLAGATFSNDNDTGLVGTMPVVTQTIQGSASSDAFTNNAITGVAANEYVGAFDFGVTGYVQNPRVHISNLLSKNIKAGVKVGGEKGYITGTFTSDATAHAGHILSGATAYVNGNKITGSIPYMNGTWGDQWETREISRGQHSYNNGGMYAYMKVPANHYINGVNWIASYQPDLWEGNIVSGKNIFGVTGSATIESLGGRRFASGTITPINDSSAKIVIPAISLPFTPSVLVYVGTARVRYGGQLIDTPLTGVVVNETRQIFNNWVGKNTAIMYNLSPGQSWYSPTASGYNAYVDQVPNSIRWYAWA